jgi:hypothetical protein
MISQTHLLNHRSLQTYELTPDQKRAIANYIQDQAKLMRYCLETARENFSEQVETEESLRTLATTLFIATQRHFGL